MKNTNTTFNKDFTVEARISFNNVNYEVNYTAKTDKLVMRTNAKGENPADFKDYKLSKEDFEVAKREIDELQKDLQIENKKFDILERLFKAL